MTHPTHHRPGGGFRNPWPVAEGDDRLRNSIWRVARDWVLRSHPPDPPPGSLPPAAPDPARPRISPGDDEVRVTWIGHATALIQLPGVTLLTDPVWSDRSSPVGFAGPSRFVAPPIRLDDLPPIDGVLLSHDHYDHLDRPTVVALHRRFGEAITWYTPLGYRDWFSRVGVERVVERDWWGEAAVAGGLFKVVCTPARHWSRRTPGGVNRRLWCGWAVVPAGLAPSGAGRVHGQARPRVWFAGDSGACPAFEEIGARLGPFDVSLLPIGAYEPRWFMGAAHMNPEEAVRAYLDAGGRGAFVAIHWGTWRLTFEDPLEPPVRTREAWRRAGLQEADLHIARHGETVVRSAGTAGRA